MAGAVTSLTWRGAATVREASELVRRGEDVAIELPADMHHAVYVHLYPHAPPGQVEEVDVTGGAELLGQLAEVRGLIALAELQSIVYDARAEVRVTSPAPQVYIGAGG